MKGRSYWNKRTLSDLETAVSYFNQAIAKDPGYALAYTGLADAYAVLPDYGASPSEDIPKAKAASLKAIELDAALARPYAVLGYIKMGREWDFAGGEAEFKKALELDPNDATAHAWYAENISTIGGREQEALAEINRAHQLDPLSAIINSDLGRNYIFARQYDEGIAVCKKLADENPTFPMAHYCLSDAYWGKRMYSRAIEEWKVYGQLSGDGMNLNSPLPWSKDFVQQAGKALSVKVFKPRWRNAKLGIHLRTGLLSFMPTWEKKTRLSSGSTTAFQEHDDGLGALKTDFSFDPIRSDPRFAELVRKVGLPQ